jgi:hypothetical protein
MALYFLALLPIPVQILVALKMYKRKQHMLYPAFWTFLWFEATRVTLEAVLWPTPWTHVYFLVYWGAGFISMLFTLAILREIFSRILSDYSQLSTLRRRGYEIALAIVTVGSILLLAPVRGRLFFSREIIEIQQAISVVSVAMLVFVVFASMLLGIRWRNELCGIACGVGLLGIGDVVTFTSTLFRARYTPTVMGWMETIAYDAAFLVIAAYFFAREKASEKPAIRPDAAEWVQSMSESLFK